MASWMDILFCEMFMCKVSQYDKASCWYDKASCSSNKVSC